MQELPTAYQQFIFMSRYARWIEAENRRETWPEAVKRYFDFMVEMLEEKHSYKVTTDVRRELENAVLNLDILPSMRALMTAGPALKRDNTCGYNCAYLPIDDLRAFDETLVILMSGTGVGFSVEDRYTSRLPIVAEHFESTSTKIIVEDSKAGWGRALRELLALLSAGQIPEWDLSKLRPSGARLATMGGRSSGPEPLNELFKYCVTTFTNAKGRRLNTLECHDLVCKIAEIVVVGGVRRSALISLSDIDDVRIRNAKSGQWWLTHSHRALANNSAVHPDDLPLETFIDEWKALYLSHSGERGIFSRAASDRIVRSNGRREPGQEWGTNPSLRKGTRVWTSTGIFPIEELENKEFTIRNLNGKSSTAKCWLSGRNKPLYRLNLGVGKDIYATAEHEWPVQIGNEVVKIATKDLKPGVRFPTIKSDILGFGTEGTKDEGFLLGWNIGDGWLTNRDAGLQIGFIVSEEDKQHGIHCKLQAALRTLGCNADLTNKKEINVNNNAVRALFSKFGVQHKGEGLATSIWTTASEDFRRGYIDGLISSDGCVSIEKDGHKRLVLSTASEKLATDFIELMGFYGIRFIAKKYMSNKANFPNKITYDREYTKIDVVTSTVNDVVRFAELFPLSHINKNEKLQSVRCSRIATNANSIKLKSIELTDLKEDVWDISVYDETHCFQIAHCITGNCSEIILRPNQFCNLTSVICRAEDGLDDIKRKVQLASIIGTWQSCLTNFKYLRKRWKDNCDEERLLGVSLNGIMDAIDLLDNPGNLQALKQVAINANRVTAVSIGISPSTAITCVKPEGTTSQLVNCPSGLHGWYADYYIRRVRQDNKDPITAFLVDAGVSWEPCAVNPKGVTVFSFAIKGNRPNSERYRTGVDNLELWKNIQLNYCEHKPSITVTVKENEWLDIAAWVWNNRDVMSGVSFLPDPTEGGVSYQQMPYEAITESQYNDLLSRAPKTLDWSRLGEFETSDTTISSREFACAGDVCEIVGSAE